MASIDRSDPVILGHVLAEHRELFCQMVAVRNAFAEPGPPTRRRVEQIVAALNALRDHLCTHFRQEECGGFLEESISRIPRLAAAATEIVKQHPALLAELDGLIGRLAGGDATAAGWEQADRDFERFWAHMMAHERSENEVVQQGYNEDLGLLD